MKENLNKENFWNELYVKYPSGVQVFCDWIDRYKHNNSWNKLFNGRLDLASWNENEEQWVYSGSSDAPKFHDLPYAMQIGIWIEFLESIQTRAEMPITDLFALDWRKNIEDTCAYLNN